jgi:phage baseplate assembly protein W
MTDTSFGFPFTVNAAGQVEGSEGDEAIREQIIQVLFTAPGERVVRPDFGCGLFSLVFEPNNIILAAAMEFTIGQALTRWLGDVILVDGVEVTAEDELITVEVAYTKRADLSKKALRVQFR